VHWVRRPYRRGDLRSARLAIAATDDLAAESTHLRGKQNAASTDQLHRATHRRQLFVPSLVKTRRISLAISTDGASPAFASTYAATLNTSSATSISIVESDERGASGAKKA